MYNVLNLFLWAWSKSELHYNKNDLYACFGLCHGGLTTWYTVLKLWSTAETPFMQVPCTGAHDRNSGTSSFKTNRAHGNNCIKNVLGWLHFATGFTDANVAARNHARKWQQQRWRVCHQNHQAQYQRNQNYRNQRQHQGPHHAAHQDGLTADELRQLRGLLNKN